jgi:hypothetical protein
MSHIALPYRIYFLYIEPILSLSAVYLTIYQPSTYLHKAHCPPPIPSSASLPTSTIAVLDQLASVLAVLGLLEGLVLHIASRRRDLALWHAVLGPLVVSDVLWMRAIVGKGPSEGYWRNPWLWDGDGWGNFGVTWAGLLLRSAFFLGIGVRR